MTGNRGPNSFHMFRREGGLQNSSSLNQHGPSTESLMSQSLSATAFQELALDGRPRWGVLGVVVIGSHEINLRFIKKRYKRGTE